MILIVKPHKLGTISTGAEDVTDLASADDIELIRAVDFGLYGNPDAANGAAAVTSHPDFRGGHPQNGLRAGSGSGGGNIHPTNRTTAPMGKPTPAPTGSPKPVSTNRSDF